MENDNIQGWQLYSQQIQNLQTALDSSSDWKRGYSMRVNLHPTEVVIQIKL
jgi:hypothetical protein